MIIRKASEEDIEQLRDIYNEAILHTTATFDMEEKSLENRQNWFYSHQGRFGLFVAVEGNKVLGFVSLSRYRNRAAFDETLEDAIYVREESRGQKIGTALLSYMMAFAKEQAGIHSIISMITAENEISSHLHKKLGFTYCGTIKDAGRKFGRYLDVDIYQIMV